jgi:hypothetical protein
LSRLAFSYRNRMAGARRKERKQAPFSLVLIPLAVKRSIGGLLEVGQEPGLRVRIAGSASQSCGRRNGDGEGDTLSISPINQEN